MEDLLNWRRGRYCLFKNNVHLVFVTKYRHDVMEQYEYARVSRIQRIASLFLLPIPTKIERKALKKALHSGSQKQVKGTVLAYLDRCYSSTLKHFAQPIKSHYLVRYQKLSLLESIKQYFKP